MAKIFTFKGKTVEELQKLTIEQFAELLPTRKRRTILRGMKDEQKKLLKTMRNHKGNKPIKTHVREMIILPEMIGKKMAIYNGHDWIGFEIRQESLGHVIGEFAGTRKKVAHSGPGIGATRGTKFTAVK